MDANRNGSNLYSGYFENLETANVVHTSYTSQGNNPGSSFLVREEEPFFLLDDFGRLLAKMNLALMFFYGRKITSTSSHIDTSKPTVNFFSWIRSHSLSSRSLA